jgi:hypothetical protein
MKILLLGEYSGLNNELKKALLDCGHDVTLAASNDFLKKYPSDINLGYGNHMVSYKIRQLLLPLFHINKLTGYDIVHVINFYIFPRLPFLNLFLIKFLKNNNGIVTLSGAGDDPFFVKFSEKTMRYSPIPSHELYDRGGRPYYMRKAAHFSAMTEYMEYVDSVIPIMYEYYSTFCAAGYESKTIKPIPIPINCNKFLYKENGASGKKIIFFHGLNRRGFKGTFLIENAFDDLSKKYPKDVECIIDGNMSFDKYMALVSRVNITLDQVFSYSLSMNSLYSMAQGKVVCGGSELESSILYNGILPPVYNLTPSKNQIFDVLEEIVFNKIGIQQISEESRAFVEMYHAPEVVAEKYILHWRSLSI